MIATVWHYVLVLVSYSMMMFLSSKYPVMHYYIYFRLQVASYSDAKHTVLCLLYTTSQMQSLSFGIIIYKLHTKWTENMCLEFYECFLKNYVATLRCDLTLDWIHHKFLKLNFLRKIRSYVEYTIRKNVKVCSRKLGKCIAGFSYPHCFTEFFTLGTINRFYNMVSYFTPALKFAVVLNTSPGGYMDLWCVCLHARQTT